MGDKKTAVILFNLGGPDAPDAVEPFLFNLFFDKRIISLPAVFRYMLAKFISKKRAPLAQEIYAQIGGKSPILEQTQAQAQVLEKKLNEKKGGYKVFITMRYWHPFSDAVVEEVKKYNPDEIILLPLYPQFSTTTVASSVEDWNKKAKKQGLAIPTRTICCYFNEDNFIQSHVDLIKPAYREAQKKGTPRILFSAHGLPQKIVDNGDPYQWQVEKTAEAIVDKLAVEGLDWKVCYQSRVGPLKWLEPNTENEIKNAASEGVPVVIVPIAFVSEHSETLVELDIEYKKMAENKGIKAYVRVPALGVDDHFMKALTHICLNSGEAGKTCSDENRRLCPDKFSQCPNRKVN